MRAIVQKINQKMLNNDFVSLYTQFEDLNKEVDKAKKIFERDGTVPKFYIRALALLENFVLSFSSEDKKKLNSNNNKSYNILK